MADKPELKICIDCDHHQQKPFKHNKSNLDYLCNHPKNTKKNPVDGSPVYDFSAKEMREDGKGRCGIRATFFSPKSKLKGRKLIVSSE